MSEADNFKKIDEGIALFRNKYEIENDFYISTESRSDWLIFKWRQITWTKSSVNYIIEIFPEFDEKEKISSWNLCAIAYLDENKKRFYHSHLFAKQKELQFISENISTLLRSSFLYIIRIDKSKIQQSTG